MTKISRLFAGLALAGMSAVASTSVGAYVITAASLNPEFTNATQDAGGYWTAIEYRTQTSGVLQTAFDSWCIEETVQDTPSPWTYNVTDVLGGTHWTAGVQVAIERLWWLADVSSGAPTYSTSGALPANATFYTAAFQIALWELVQENSTAYNLSAGAINLGAVGSGSMFNEDVRNVANGWLSQVTSANYGGGSTSLEYLDTTNGQDRIRVRVPGNGGDDPVPLPATVWLLALGAVALAARKRTK